MILRHVYRVFKRPAAFISKSIVMFNEDYNKEQCVNVRESHLMHVSYDIILQPFGYAMNRIEYELIEN